MSNAGGKKSLHLLTQVLNICPEETVMIPSVAVMDFPEASSKIQHNA
jgi:hypothetical protein